MHPYFPLEYIQHLEARLQRLEEENEQLKQQLESIKPIYIENINYKIQELVVEELSGTLNIGLSAEADAEEIKKLMEDDQEGLSINDLESERDT